MRASEHIGERVGEHASEHIGEHAVNCCDGVGNRARCGSAARCSDNFVTNFNASFSSSGCVNVRQRCDATNAVACTSDADGLACILAACRDGAIVEPG
jgi:hypothetical protein